MSFYLKMGLVYTISSNRRVCEGDSIWVKSFAKKDLVIVSLKFICSLFYKYICRNLCQ